MANINERAAKRQEMDAFYADSAAMEARFRRTVLGEYLDVREGGIAQDVAAEKRATQFHGIVGMMDQLHKEKLGKPMLVGIEEDRNLVGLILPMYKHTSYQSLLVLNGKIDVVEPQFYQMPGPYQHFVQGTDAHESPLERELFDGDEKKLTDAGDAFVRSRIASVGIKFRFSSENPAHHDAIEKAVLSALAIIEEERQARKAKEEAKIAEEVTIFGNKLDEFVDLEAMFNAPSFDPGNGKTLSE